MALQRSFDDLGVPLSEVTFCVLDLETTGGSPQDGAITEIGAIKVRRGETEGTFQTLVDPRIPISPFVQILTGISDDAVQGAPGIEDVFPSLIEFLGDAVLVAHNARFDVGFLNAALARSGHERLRNRVIDTAALARKALQGEVRDHRLETLASHLRCSHRPNHRAFQDVLATCDVLHHLIERVAGYGITTLDDLLAYSRTKVDGTFNKISLTNRLPRAPGIYRFLGSGGNTIYVGKATDLRSRVRSYFYGDSRRKIADLLREVQAITFEVHGSTVEAEIAEAQAIASEQPHYNRAGKRTSAWYLKLVIRERIPRLHTTRQPKNDGNLYLGPFRSQKEARLLQDAVRKGTRMHGCSDPRRCNGCALHDLGTCSLAEPKVHRREARVVAAALTGDHGRLLEPLRARMDTWSSQQRYEEAAALRDAADSLERTLSRHARVEALRRAGALEASGEGRVISVHRARLVGARPAGADTLDLREHGDPPDTSYLDDRTVKEGTILLRWLARPERELLHVSRPWCSPVSAGPFEAFRPPRGKGRSLERPSP